MIDQKLTFRHIALPINDVDATQCETPCVKQSHRTIAVTGGKGGVGKSNFAVNVAIALAALSKRVTLIDADTGLANADLLCGVNPKKRLGHVLNGKCRLEDTIIKLDSGVRFVPGGSGVEELTAASFGKDPQFLSDLQRLEEASDFTLVDTGAGIAENVISVLLAATEVVVVTMPEPTALINAYATIKIIHRRVPQKPISLVVNNVSGIGEAKRVYQQLNCACERFLSRKVTFLGAIPQDAQLVEAVCEQVPVLEYAPNSPASRALRFIAKQIFENSIHPLRQRGQIQSFWRLLLTEPQN